MAREDALVWIDLEMTGLDPEKCVIVEIASIVTDGHLDILAEGPNLVIHQPAEALAAMEPIVQQMHERSGLTGLIIASDISLAQAEQATVDFVAQHCVPRTAPMAGNSIWKDRQFVERYMPRLSQLLHYRNVDVSTVKEVAKRWYPGRVPPPKRETHRALDDIRESIEELRWYRKHIFIAP
jgi:oligoribonuclease